MSYEACGIYVLVEVIPAETKTKGGIILADQTVEREQFAAQRGKIMDVGPHSEYITPEHTGRIAIFGRYAGAELENGKYRLIDNRDIKGLEKQDG